MRSRRLYGHGRLVGDRWVLDREPPPSRLKLLELEVESLRKQVKKLLWHVKMSKAAQP